VLYFDATSAGRKLPFFFGNMPHSWRGPCVEVMPCEFSGGKALRYGRICS
jgi:hypothetical protein